MFFVGCREPMAPIHSRWKRIFLVVIKSWICISDNRMQNETWRHSEEPSLGDFSPPRCLF